MPSSTSRRCARSALTILLAVTPVSPAQAHSAAPSTDRRSPRPEFSLTVYPSRIDLPPDARHHTAAVHIKNAGSAAVPIQMDAAEFAQASDGSIAFQPPGSWSAASWVHTRPERFTLQPGRTQEVRVDITVPGRPEPGERYVGLLFKTPPAPAAGNILLERSIAAKLFIAVPGTVIRDIDVGSLEAPRVAFGGSLSLSLPVHNRGNVHQDYVLPHRLAAQVHDQTLAFPDFTVLAHSTRVVTTEWTDPPLFCLCRVSISVPDGQGQTIRRETAIAVLPLREAGGTLIATLGVFLMLRAGRRYHRSALAKARQQGYHDALDQTDDSRQNR